MDGSLFVSHIETSQTNHITTGCNLGIIEKLQ
jgi:hypothetical protein